MNMIIDSDDARSSDDSDAWRRLREKEDREEQEREELKKSAPVKTKSAPDSTQSQIQQMDVLIEQLNQLYNQFASGVESRPPIELRKTAEQKIAALMAMGKSTPAVEFRVNTIQAKFNTYRERWDRMLKDLELGKKPARR